MNRGRVFIYYDDDVFDFANLLDGSLKSLVRGLELKFIDAELKELVDAFFSQKYEIVRDECRLDAIDVDDLGWLLD